MHGLKTAAAWAIVLLLSPLSSLAIAAGDGAAPDFLESGRTVHPLVYNLTFNVSFEWDATPGQFSDFEGGLRLFSSVLYDMTDGQFYVGTFILYKNGVNWANADIHVFNQSDYRPTATIGGWMWGGYINVGRDAWGYPWNSFTGGHLLAHENGHYLLGLPDEYDDATGMHCIDAGADTCMMADTYNRSELCTGQTHDATHTQDPYSCWSYIKYYFPDVIEVAGIPDPGPAQSPAVLVFWNYPDLRVLTQEAVLSPQSGNEDDTVNCSFSIHNSGALLNGWVTVRLYCDTVSVENVLCQLTVDISGNENVSAIASFHSPGGTHSIIGFIDPDNRVQEVDETNNQFVRQLRRNSRPRISDALSGFTLPEDTPLTLNLSQYGSDAEDEGSVLRWCVTDSDPRYMACVTGPQGASGAVTFTPVPDWSGKTDFIVSVTDTQNCSSARKVALDYTPVNDAPVACRPFTVPESIARGGTAVLYAGASDAETPFAALKAIFEWRPPTLVDWIPLAAESAGSSFRAVLSVPFDVPAGRADIRVAFEDGDGARSDFFVSEKSLLVQNNRPAIVNASSGAPSVVRGGTVTFFINGTDAETAENFLTPVVEYRSGPMNWTPLDCPRAQYLGGAWKLPIEINSSAPANVCDVRFAFIDGDGETGDWTQMDSFLEIVNSPPRVDAVRIAQPRILRGQNTTCAITARDYETPADGLVVGVRWLDDRGKEKTGATMAIEWVQNHFEAVLSPPKEFSLGNYSLEIVATDSDGGRSTAFPNSRLEVLNNPPKASFTSSGPVRTGEAVLLDASGTGDVETSPAELVYCWTCVDGALAGSGNRTTATFSKPGSYKISLTVTDREGAHSTADAVVTVTAGIAIPDISAGGPDLTLLAGAGMIIASAGFATIYLLRGKRTRVSHRTRQGRKASGVLHARAPPARRKPGT